MDNSASRGWLGLFAALSALIVLVSSMQPAAMAAAPSTDTAPAVLSVSPSPDAIGVPLAISLTITFSEPVALNGSALEWICERSQVHTPTATGGPTTFTITSDRPLLPGERCQASVFQEGVSDLDTDDPPDSPNYIYSWSFSATGVPVILNELDTVTPDGAGDFVELFDGGRGHTDLSGLTLVLYRGDEASVYLAVALDGYVTDDEGYFTLGASGIVGADLRLADGILRDGPDGIGLYDAPKSSFPYKAPVTTENLLDAMAYGPADERLRVLLAAGQQPLDENARGVAATDSNQRCPNGAGQPRMSAAFVQNTPTPGATNMCRFDDPPTVASVSPAAGASAVALDAAVAVTFSEPVVLAEQPLELVCTRSGGHLYDLSGGPISFIFTPQEPFAPDETCVATLMASQISDADDEDPPNLLKGPYSWSFQTIRPVAEGLLINEIDADTPGVDTAEFIELFDGGGGTTALDGLSVVFFNGTDDRSYLALSLDGQATDKNGYFVLGNAAVVGAGIKFPNGTLQNGPDAVVLMVGDADDFPNGTPVSADKVMDAIVYGPASQPDAGLQRLLEPGQPQIDENGRGEGGAHSNQRCPNGAGGSRKTTGYKQNTPTPGTANHCVTDKAPTVVEMTPARDEKGVSLSAAITIRFDEAVNVTGKWLTVKCSSTGTHAYQTAGGPAVFTMTMNTPFTYEETCTVTLNAALVTDQDTDDPPDAMAGALSWSFSTAKPPAGFILINEIDADTTGSDTAEFIELYDGGAGQTSLDGLALVLFNGGTSRSYKAIDLDGFKTDASGYFVVGNAAVHPGLVIGNGTLQNGPDGVALYAAEATQFPTDSPVSQSGLLDAVVYGDPDSVTPELLALLANGQAAVDENGRGSADLHSLQRCPNGAGEQRHTDSYQPNRPTPGQPSACTWDEPPILLSGSPQDGAANISINSRLSLTFSEPVAIQTGGVKLSCAGGERALTASGGPVTFEFAPGLLLPAGATCQVRLTASLITDIDADDPPDHPANDSVWSFTTVPAPPAATILINELDTDTPGSDKKEFIELYDGGAGQTDLAGLVLVLYNGDDDRSYLAIDLNGLRTDGDGYLIAGNKGVAGVGAILPNGAVQNGPDAVALYAGRAADFPNGTPLHIDGLIDAVVYGAGGSPDSGLLALLLPGEHQVDEAGRGPADLYANGRCPDGAGGGRHTNTFRQGAPSPGGPNVCLLDEPPAIMAIQPADGGVDVSTTASAAVTFSEAVVVEPEWFAIVCSQSGAHAADASGGPSNYVLTPHSPFATDETCTVTLKAARIADADSDDPPDHPAADFSWSFTTVAAPPPPHAILINEIDADTPGHDVAEFVELYDGGVGRTDLSGLVLVFWNGNNDKVYRAIDLNGRQTGNDGYFLVGNKTLGSADVILPDGALQNGPDAVAVYAGSAAGFPAGAPLTTDGLLDAVVYGPADSPDVGLLALLEEGQLQADEASGGDAETHSLQRCPNGAGGARRTAAYRPDAPTPGSPNPCRPADAAPLVVAVSPADGARDVAVGSPIEVEFSEDVVVTASRLSILCETSGSHSVALSGGPRLFTLTPALPFVADESCTVTVPADAVGDVDEIDPPDALAAGYMWIFYTKTTEPPPPPPPPTPTPTPTPPPPTPSIPVAGFVAAGPVWIGQSMTFTNTSTGPGPLVFTWDFGDGQPSSHDAHPTHRYAAMGSYTVTLTVNGPTGTASHHETVQVRARRVYVALVAR